MDNLGIELGNPGKTISWGLYVHIPFCDYRCRYCDFYFETTKSLTIQRRLTGAVLHEAERRKASMDFLPAPKTLYLGGGTPSALDPGLLRNLLEGLGQIWGLPREEGTLEANPEGINPALLEALASLGINRLSLGVQSLQDEVLRQLGRRAWKDLTLGALDLVKRRWSGSWNLDIMTGLPGQTWPQLKEEMNRLLDFGPDHVSLYSLTLEPGTPLEALVERKQVLLPLRDESDSLWLRARDHLISLGWNWYEISNFSRPGRESRHNQGYWRMEEYLGLGPGAHGTFSERTTGRPVRIIQPKMGEYLRGEPPKMDVLTPREFFLEHLITGLRTSEGLSWDRLRRRFALDLQTAWMSKWQELQDRGLVDSRSLEEGSSALVLTTQGRLLLDPLLTELASLEETLTLTQGVMVDFLEP